MKAQLQELVRRSIKELYPEATFPDIQISIPQARYGDFATNIALRLAPQLEGGLPKITEVLAATMMQNDEGRMLIDCQATRNGFINFKLSDKFLQHQITHIREKDHHFGHSDHGKGKKVLLEFVSANPTGPLHIGHGRWAVIGDDIAALLSSSGFKVEREYYVNDIGTQVIKLEESVRARAESREVPEGGYGGAYVSEVAEKLRDEIGRSNFREILLAEMLNDHKRVLKKLKVDFDDFFRESTLHKSGKVKTALDEIKAKGLTFEEDGALWFKSQELGDDKNRVLVRKDGETTYFTADIAYHLDKFRRGFDRLINVWGTDHHGYVARLKAALKALDLPIENFEIIIGQLVALFRGAEPVRMSKRTGDMITLEEVIDEIGPDATRFFLTMVSVSSHLEFDLELAKQSAPSNPVYYVQYAHARISSIFREGVERGVRIEQTADLTLLVHPSERELMRKLIDLPDEILGAALAREPHRMVIYAKELAAVFHNFYHKCRVLSEDEKLTAARLQLVDATRIVLRNVLELLSVTAPERM
ncbi:MAG: arginine--tRNA ligase [Candidatus Margulisiibacteriota bacterium]